ncbi:MAG TPA: hemolysin III family protein [Stellaceae bacterium]|nr:hemolysin III family protein [Stellaceae bacterium]
MLWITAGFAIVALSLIASHTLITAYQSVGGRVDGRIEGRAAGLVMAAGWLLYGTSLVASAISSLIYNGWHKHRQSSPWRFADHICIFLLIAGTYTPFALATGRIGSLLAPIWVMAAVGIALKIILRLRFDRWFVVFYLAMGWLVVIGIDRIAASLPSAAFGLLLAGGLIYSAGVVFYILDARFRWGSTVWHSAVLVAQASHFVAIFGWLMVAG